LSKLFKKGIYIELEERNKSSEKRNRNRRDSYSSEVRKRKGKKIGIGKMNKELEII
jgi:hypothetical protein